MRSKESRKIGKSAQKRADKQRYVSGHLNGNCHGRHVAESGAVLEMKVTSEFTVRSFSPNKKLLYISKTKISIRRTYTELQLAWEGPSQTTRISKFEGKTAALYFIFLSHFLMPLIRRRLWFGLGMVYGSTVFHATRRIQESGGFEGSF